MKVLSVSYLSIDLSTWSINQTNCFSTNSVRFREKQSWDQQIVCIIIW